MTSQMATWRGPKTVLIKVPVVIDPFWANVTCLLDPEPVVLTLILSAAASIIIKESRKAASSCPCPDGAAKVPVSVEDALTLPVMQKNNEYGWTTPPMVSVPG